MKWVEMQFWEDCGVLFLKNSKVVSGAGMSWEAGLCPAMRTQQKEFGIYIKSSLNKRASQKAIIKLVFLKDLWGCHVMNELEAKRGQGHP